MGVRARVLGIFYFFQLVQLNLVPLDLVNHKIFEDFWVHRMLVFGHD